MKDLNITTDKETLFVYEGQAPEQFNPKPIEIEGTLEAPMRFLEKKVLVIDQKKAHILVDRDKMSITLFVDEKSEFGDKIEGRLSYHPDFVKLGINSGEYRTPADLAELIKMNKAFFENRSKAAELVVLLRNFKAKVNKDVETNINPNKDDKRIVLQQAVDSNLPPMFTVLVPIFKGTKKEKLEIETYFNANDLTCTLVSSSANEIMQDSKDNAIDVVLDKIREIAPDIAIIEI